MNKINHNSNLKPFIFMILVIGLVVCGVMTVIDKSAVDDDMDIKEPVLGEEMIINNPDIIITLPNGRNLRSMTNTEKRAIINQFKNKTMRNGNQIYNSLTEEENNLLMDLIIDKYKGVQINGLPPEAFGKSEITGKTILKLEYLISNL